MNSMIQHFSKFKCLSDLFLFFFGAFETSFGPGVHISFFFVNELFVIMNQINQCNSFSLCFFLRSLFENMDRICDDNYIPSPTDVLRARVRTNGIIETNFRVNDTIIRQVIFAVTPLRSKSNFLE